MILDQILKAHLLPWDIEQVTANCIEIMDKEGYPICTRYTDNDRLHQEDIEVMVFIKDVLTTILQAHVNRKARVPDKGKGRKPGP